MKRYSNFYLPNYCSFIGFGFVLDNLRKLICHGTTETAFCFTKPSAEPVCETRLFSKQGLTVVN